MRSTHIGCTIRSSEREMSSGPERCRELGVEYLKELGVDVSIQVLFRPYQSIRVEGCRICGVKGFLAMVGAPPLTRVSIRQKWDMRIRTASLDVSGPQ